MFGALLAFGAGVARAAGTGVGRISTGRAGAGDALGRIDPAEDPATHRRSAPGSVPVPGVRATAAAVLVGLGFGTPVRCAGGSELRAAGAALAVGAALARAIAAAVGGAFGTGGAGVAARAVARTSGAGGFGRRTRRRRARRNRRRRDRRRRFQSHRDRAHGRHADWCGRELVTRRGLKNVLSRLRVGLRRLLRNRTRIGRAPSAPAPRARDDSPASAASAAGPRERDGAARLPARAERGRPRERLTVDLRRRSARCAQW